MAFTLLPLGSDIVLFTPSLFPLPFVSGFAFSFLFPPFFPPVFFFFWRKKSREEIRYRVAYGQIFSLCAPLIFTSFMGVN